MKALRMAAALMMSIVLMASAAVSVNAESSTYDGNCSFNGKKIVSDFSSQTVADAIRNLQPGDDVTFTVSYTNRYDGKTDWYMENSIVKTLEKTDQAKKVVAGTGRAENGGYTYSLIHNSKSGKQTVLFSNDKVGGEVRPANLEGLEPATNALDSWFYIDTLDKGESGNVVLKIAFDGETEVNDYMDTDGEVNVRFAVELPEEGSPDGGSKGSGKLIDTGDQSTLLMWSIALIGAGLLLLIFLFFVVKRRKHDKTAALILALVLVAGLGSVSSYAADEVDEFGEAYSGTKYTVTVYSGKEGKFSDGSTAKVYKDLSYGDTVRIDINNADTNPVLNPDVKDKYYVRGFKMAGHDNDETSKMNIVSYEYTVKGDAAFTVAYGMKGAMVKYTVNYVDGNGKQVHAPEVFYGMAGDYPVVSYQYVEGYTPNAYNLGKTLTDNEADNVFTFTYRKAETAQTGADDEADGADAANGTNGAGGNGAAGANNGAGGNGAAGTNAGNGDGAAGGDQAQSGTNDVVDLDGGDVPLTEPEEAEPTESSRQHSQATLIAAIGAAALIVAGIAFAVVSRKKKKEEEA